MEHELSFSEDLFLSEIFDISELDELETVNLICDSSVKELKVIEKEFISKMGGKDQYGMVRKKAEIIPVLSYFITSNKWKDLHKILSDVQKEIKVTLINDSVNSIVDSVLFPEENFVVKNNSNWGEFYFKSTPAMQAHVHIKNMIAKISLIKALATRFLITTKLREIQIENFKEVVEKPDTLLPKLKRIKLTLRNDFFDESLTENTYGFSYPALMTQRQLTFSEDEVVTAQMSSFKDFDLEIDLSKFLELAKIPPIKEEEERIIEEKFLLTPKTPNLYVDIINKIELEGTFDFENLLVVPTHGSISNIKNGSFYFECSTPGYVHFKVFNKETSSFMGTFTFPVQLLPIPSVKVSQTTSGNISLLTMRRIAGLDLFFKDIDWLNALDFYSVKGFQMIRVGANGETWTENNKSNYFNSTVKALVQSAKSGDRYIFKDIKVIRQGQEFKLNPLILEVI